MVLEEFKFDFTQDIDPLVRFNPKSLSGKNIDYIIMMVNHDGFNSDTPSPLISLMGKPVVSYVKKVCDKQPITIDMEEDDDVLELIKPSLGVGEWTIVLFSDTPLLTYKTLAEAFRYAETNDVNVAKLPRGYIFRTEYIKRANQIYAPNTILCDKQDFLYASNFEELAILSEIMKGRILSSFMKNGVQIVDPASTYIESLVTIGDNSIIYPNTCIMGDSHIGSNTTIGFGSTIKNAVIGDKCNVQGALILSSVVQDSSLIEQSTIENNSLVEKNCVIKQYSVINSAKIGENSYCCWSKVKGVEVQANTRLEN